MEKLNKDKGDEIIKICRKKLNQVISSINDEFMAVKPNIICKVRIS